MLLLPTERPEEVPSAPRTTAEEELAPMPPSFANERDPHDTFDPASGDFFFAPPPSSSTAAAATTTTVTTPSMATPRPIVTQFMSVKEDVPNEFFVSRKENRTRRIPWLFRQTVLLREFYRSVVVRQAPFHPQSWFRTVWNLIMMAVLIYTLVEIPLVIAFGYESLAVFVLNVIMNFIFIFDIFLTFHTSYIDDDHEIVKSYKQITRHYIRRWFILDTVASFPFDLIALIVYTTGGSQEAIEVLIYMKLLRLLRVSYLYRNSVIKSGSPTITLLLLCTTFLMASHWIACLFWRIGMSDPEVGWLSRQPSSLLTASHFSQYVVAFYWSIVTMTTLGYGDITPVGYGEDLFAIFVSLTGVMCYAVIIGSVGNILVTRFQSETVFERKVEEIHVFGRLYNLPYDLIQRVIKYHVYLWKRRKTFSEHTLVDDLPLELKIDVMHANAMNIVRESMLFEEGCSMAFKHRLTSLFGTRHLCQPEDVLYFEGDEITDLIWVRRGHLELVRDLDGPGELVIALRGEHQMCGDLGLFFGDDDDDDDDTAKNDKRGRKNEGETTTAPENEIPTNVRRRRHATSCVAHEFSDIIFINAAEFLHLLKEFPREAALLSRVAAVRWSVAEALWSAHKIARGEIPPPANEDEGIGDKTDSPLTPGGGGSQSSRWGGGGVLGGMKRSPKKDGGGAPPAIPASGSPVSPIARLAAFAPISSSLSLAEVILKTVAGSANFSSPGDRIQQFWAVWEESILPASDDARTRKVMDDVRAEWRRSASENADDDVGRDDDDYYDNDEEERARGRGSRDDYDAGRGTSDETGDSPNYTRRRGRVRETYHSDVMNGGMTALSLPPSASQLTPMGFPSPGTRRAGGGSTSLRDEPITESEDESDEGGPSHSFTTPGESKESSPSTGYASEVARRQIMWGGGARQARPSSRSAAAARSEAGSIATPAAGAGTQEGGESLVREIQVLLRRAQMEINRHEFNRSRGGSSETPRWRPGEGSQTSRVSATPRLGASSGLAHLRAMSARGVGLSTATTPNMNTVSSLYESRRAMLPSSLSLTLAEEVGEAPEATAEKKAYRGSPVLSALGGVKRKRFDSMGG